VGGLWLQRTADAVSAHGDLHMSISLLTFFVVYSSVFGVGYSYMVRLIRKGPQDDPTIPPTGTPARPLSAAVLILKEVIANGYRFISYLVCDYRLRHADVYRDGRF
jgi:hypothetical protein